MMTGLSVSRLHDLHTQIVEAVPPLSPPPQYWLSSDASSSYCYECARLARARELGLASPPEVPEFSFDRTRDQETFDDGIDGGSWYSGASDSTEACETCRRTLDYSLTDYGLRAEIEHWLEHPGWAGDKAETSYELDRLFAGLTYDGADPDLVTAAITIAEKALASLQSNTLERKP